MSNIQLNMERLKEIYGDANVISFYIMKFRNKYPITDVVSFSYNGHIDNMPIIINDIFSQSSMFQKMAEIFKNYHENLDYDDYEEFDKKSSPLQLQIKIKTEQDNFTLDYNYVLDYNKEHLRQIGYMV